MKVKILLGTFVIFGGYFSNVYAGYTIDSGANGILTFTTNSNTELVQFGASNKISAENTVTGNGITWFNVYDNDGNILAIHWNTFVVSNWTEDTPEETVFPTNSTEELIDNFTTILWNNIGYILSFSAGILVWLLLKKWIFGGVKRI